jgi:hypothetical protein
VTASESLSRLEQRLNGISARLNEHETGGKLTALTEAANEIGRSWSGSYLGYQSRVYFQDFQSVPAGCYFSIEWGFNEVYGSGGTVGRWMEVTRDFAIEHIHTMAAAKDLIEPRKTGPD